MLISTVLYIRTYGCNVPFGDEFSLVAAVAHQQPITLTFLWSPHNEHRIVIPRLAYLGLAALTHGDFRAGMYVIALTLAALAAAMIRTAWRLRGWTSYADAFFPLAFLHLGHGENLLWSFQVTFVSSTLLACGLLFLLLHSRQPLTWRTALIGGLCLIGLPLCGANGLPLVPPLAVWLAYWAIPKRPASPASIGNLVLVLALAGVALGLVGIYFIGLRQSLPRSPDWPVAARVATEFLSVSFGAGATAGWPYVGYAVSVLVIFAAVVLLVVWWAQPPERVRCAGLLLFLVGMVGLSLAVGWGRGAGGQGAGFSHRYAVLSVPVLCTVYFLGEIAGSAGLARFLQMALFTCLAILLVPNTQTGLFYGKFKYARVKPLEDDLGPKYTAAQIAQKHPFVYPYSKEHLESCVEMLRRARIGRFKWLRPPAPSGGAASPAPISDRVGKARDPGGG